MKIRIRQKVGKRVTVISKRLLWVGVLIAATAIAVADIPAQKLSLIRQTMVSMKLDIKIQGMINAKVEARTQKIRVDNPQISDSLTNEIRTTIAQVYAENRDGRDGLDAQIYAVFDRHLTEQDLKFASNFNSSDAGKRYREVAPRIVSESVGAGQRWSDRLDPEIRRRLEERFREWNLRLL